MAAFLFNDSCSHPSFIFDIGGCEIPYEGLFHGKLHKMRAAKMTLASRVL
jgi:hypothetical protein